MQEPIFSPTITSKLYKERSILIGTFLGGPLVGGYLIAQNFKALDEPKKVVQTWFISILFLLGVFAIGFIPALDKIPAVVYSFAFCMAAHFCAKKFQGAAIASHQENGGRFFSTGRAAIIGFVIMLLMIAALLGLFYLLDPETVL